MSATNPMIQTASLSSPTDEDKLTLENSAGELTWPRKWKRYQPAASPDFTSSDVFAGSGVPKGGGVWGVQPPPRNSEVFTKSNRIAN
jgi:hypothetical protein